MLLFDSFLEDELLTTVMKRDVFIAIQRDGQIGSGTRENPYDGSTLERFDALLFTIDTNPNTRFHFGPGIFQDARGR
jgi:hypothetical protein